MPQHTFSPPSDGSMSPKAWYLAVSAQPGFIHDAAQERAIDALDELWHQLVDFKIRRKQLFGRTLLGPEIPKGIYFWGGVGRGKSFLMDVFYDCVPYRRKRRIHFHNFMAEVHRELKSLAQEKDPMRVLADNIVKSSRLLCFDEFHVSDIADAMILQRLLEALIERGVVLLATSNFHPDGLYPDGLQRKKFIPTIELLKRELKVIEIDGGNDFRLREMVRESMFIVPDDEASEARLEILFEHLSQMPPQEDIQIEIVGRMIPVKKIAGGAVWFEFKDICGGPRAQADYLAIAHRFHTVFVSHIPKLTAEFAAEAHRFAWLIDVFYDNRVKLVASAATLPLELYDDASHAGQFDRTASRLIEMQSTGYLSLLHHTQNVSLHP